VENEFLNAKKNPLSTFSIDVDAASYSNIRRFINGGSFPPKDAVRIEEMINYFAYKYHAPQADLPISINTVMSSCPWNTDHKLIKVNMSGKDIPVDHLPSNNLVFLIDVSGSMTSEDKLPLLKRSFRLLVDQLRKEDLVSIVVYAGNAGLVLPATSGDKKEEILAAIERLEAGGSTAGGAGIELAYKIALENFIKGGNNRVILATDGDFNVGVHSNSDLTSLIEEKRKDGVFLTTLGFGTGNYKDATMELLADKGNGNAAYIDNIMEAHKVFVKEMGATLNTIAKDVKLQIEFNPAKVKAYRLIGYENRILAKEDFNNDTKDAGEIGSGHHVTAFYEIIPTGSKEQIDGVDSLKYQKVVETENSTSNETMTIKVRFKDPDASKSKLIIQTVSDENIALENTDDDFRFAAAVAEFGMLLRDSKFKGKSSFKSVIALAKEAKGMDEEGYRSEFIRLVENAEIISGSASIKR
jgi:Ca-activated chloride channel family protein